MTIDLCIQCIGKQQIDFHDFYFQFESVLDITTAAHCCLNPSGVHSNPRYVIVLYQKRLILLRIFVQEPQHSIN